MKQSEDEVRLEVTSTHDVTVAIATVTIGDREVSASGTAKRMPDDRQDDAVGDLLASGRALQALGRHLEKLGHGRDRDNLHQREHRARVTRAQEEAEAENRERRRKAAAKAKRTRERRAREAARAREATAAEVSSTNGSSEPSQTSPLVAASTAS